MNKDMPREEFSELLKKGNYTPEFKKFLENATIAWEESKRPELKGKIKVRWKDDHTLQPYCEEFQFGTEEGFRNGGIAFKINMKGATHEDIACFEKWLKKWSPPDNFKFSDCKEGEGKITFLFPDYEEGK